MATVADQMQQMGNRLFPTDGSMPSVPTMGAMPGSAGGMMPQQYDDSAASNLAKITTSDSPLMKIAAASGAAQANRRGLLNSSIAVGASQAETIKAATPIATADASVNAQKNLQANDAGYQMDRLGFSTAADMAKIKQQGDISATAQAADIAAQKDRLTLSGNQELTRLGAASGYEQQRMQLQATIDSAAAGTAAENQRSLTVLQGTIQSALTAQVGAADLQKMAVQFQQSTAQNDQQNAAQLRAIAASGDQDVRRALVAADEARQQLSMQLAAGDREKVAASAVQIFAAEAQIRSNLLANTSMPAAERASYEQAISSLGDPVRAFLNQLYGSTGSTQATGVAPPSTSGFLTYAPAIGTA